MLAAMLRLRLSTWSLWRKMTGWQKLMKSFGRPAASLPKTRE